MELTGWYAILGAAAVLERGQALFAMIADKEPRAQMHIINKAGHFNYREHPKEFNAMLQSWVAVNA